MVDRYEIYTYINAEHPAHDTPKSVTLKLQEVLFSHSFCTFLITFVGGSDPLVVWIHPSILKYVHKAMCTCKYPLGQLQWNAVFVHSIFASMKNKLPR